ncbi:CDP-diacylglycerol--serine O-phosphatidyltransferase [Metallumcola ferriviriculae]|uniref:CDP-diacylglycerol--serine O-phosphatidyltransferase n=1 Tax=Metallumcola ferriviriculae TaxID=3039180 RepID=A0AAU0UQH3_9FIRM|nr:CDP-diacylglycerol--serine O-phosphatidyltransferase [Desulfitibacteraceae bacterium MK1]
MKKHISNCFTLGNLMLGITALVLVLRNDFQAASLMILLAGVFDGLDGKVARRMNSTSFFGKELDSLSDMVSFGVAPAILMYAQFYQVQTIFWYFLFPAFFALCGAIRLARFNTLNISEYFLGIPIPLAGGLVAVFGLFARESSLLWVSVLLISLGFLMISNIKVPKY